MTTTVLTIFGMLLGLIKDIAKAEDDAGGEFDWRAFLGERPFQVILRILVVVGVLSQEGMELILPFISQLGLSGVESAASTAAPVLIGLYGDKIGKTVLEKAESVTESVPIVKTLFKWGKKLT